MGLKKKDREKAPDALRAATRVPSSTGTLLDDRSLYITPDRFCRETSSRSLVAGVTERFFVVVVVSVLGG